MANTYEQDIQIQNIDGNGNVYKSYPNIKWGNIIAGMPALAIIDTPGESDPVQFETNDVEVV